MYHVSTDSHSFNGQFRKNISLILGVASHAGPEPWKECRPGAGEVIDEEPVVPRMFQWESSEATGTRKFQRN